MSIPQTKFEPIVKTSTSYGCVHSAFVTMDAEFAYFDTQKAYFMSVNTGTTENIAIFIDTYVQYVLNDDGVVYMKLFDKEENNFIIFDKVFQAYNLQTFNILAKPLSHILNVLSNFYATNEYVMDIYDGGKFISQEEQQVIRHRSNPAEINKIFMKFMYRWFNQPVIDYSGIFSIYDGKEDSQYNIDTMSAMMLYYKRNTEENRIIDNLISNFDKLRTPRVIPDGKYFTYLFYNYNSIQAKISTLYYTFMWLRR